MCTHVSVCVYVLVCVRMCVCVSVRAEVEVREGWVFQCFKVLGVLIAMHCLVSFINAWCQSRGRDEQ